MPAISLRNGCPIPAPVWLRACPITQNSPATNPTHPAKIKCGVASGKNSPSGGRSFTKPGLSFARMVNTSR